MVLYIAIGQKKRSDNHCMCKSMVRNSGITHQHTHSLTSSTLTFQPSHSSFELTTAITLWPYGQWKEENGLLAEKEKTDRCLLSVVLAKFAVLPVAL